MDRHQRRRARRIHRQRRAFQPQHVSDPSRGHTHRRAGQPVPLQRTDVLAAVAGRENSGEDPRRGPAQRHRVDPGMLERLPGDLQHEPLLGIHRQDLTWRDAEEPGIEVGGVLDKRTPPRIGLALGIRIRVKQPLGVPPSIIRELRYGVAPLRNQIPKPFRAIRAAGKPAADSYHRHRLGCALFVFPQSRTCLVELDSDLLQVAEELVVLLVGAFTAGGHTQLLLFMIRQIPNRSAGKFRRGSRRRRCAGPSAPALR